MKAKDIVAAMTYDSALAAHGQVWAYDGRPVDGWILGIFGEFKIEQGEIKRGTYLSVYSECGNDIYPFQVNHKPEVVLVYTDGITRVWLWRID